MNGQRKQVWTLQVIRNEVVKFLFVRGGKEFLHDSLAVRVGDIFKHLPPQGALANRLQSRFQIGEVLFRGQRGKLRFETFQIAESVFVHNADQPV